MEDAPQPAGARRMRKWVRVLGAVVLLGLVLLILVCWSGSRHARSMATRNLLAQIGIAIKCYAGDWGALPPDCVPAGCRLVDFQGRTINVSGRLESPEALYYFLCNPWLSARHPYLEVWAETETADHDSNGFPEIVDSWGQPIIYNHPGFSTGGFDNSTDPFHNWTTYDLYSVGRDGQTGTTPLPDPREDLAGFCRKAMDEASDGEGDDDIQNWIPSRAK